MRDKVRGIQYCIKYMMKKPAQCPFWFGHRAVQNRLLGDLLFEKWHKRPQSAYKLYWVHHPDEYEKANKAWKK